MEEINTTHTEVVIFDNLRAWNRYFDSACKWWYFITILKTCTNYCYSKIIKWFRSNHATGILKIDVISFYIFIFFHNSRIFPVISTRTVTRQYITLSKSFSTNLRELKNFQNHTVRVFQFFRQIQNSCFTKVKPCFFLFAKIKNKLIQIYCFPAALTPPLGIPF